ncbi:MAG TPA: PRC-barrel domain-containing protein [Nitrososphaerales archaeon]|nr:PRC-barrel domain-containing protein [Nitrososphaerales archaeon]
MRSFKKEDVVGKTVIETSGAVKGMVKDVVFDLRGGVTFLVQGADGRDSQVPLSKVTGISEHVVVRSEAAAESGTSGYGTTCKFCGASKPVDERWCPSCGRSQV